MGDSKGADRYQQAAQALQPQPPPPPVGEIRIAEKLHEATAAVAGNRLADAYRLADEAIDAAPQAVDGQSISWTVGYIASTLASHKEAAKGDKLYQRLFAVAETWKMNDLRPLLAVTANYVNFLRDQEDRLGEVPAAIEQYRRVLIEADGPDSGSLTKPLRMSIEFAHTRSQWSQADASARELLALQESLSGNTSEPYLGDLQLAARMHKYGDNAGCGITDAMPNAGSCRID
jgi:hypothetical protein